jgi:hypothetical protein
MELRENGEDGARALLGRERGRGRERLHSFMSFSARMRERRRKATSVWWACGWEVECWVER